MGTDHSFNETVRHALLLLPGYQRSLPHSSVCSTYSHCQPEVRAVRRRGGGAIMTDLLSFCLGHQGA